MLSTIHLDSSSHLKATLARHRLGKAHANQSYFYLPLVNEALKKEIAMVRAFSQVSIY